MDLTEDVPERLSMHGAAKFEEYVEYIIAKVLSPSVSTAPM